MGIVGHILGLLTDFPYFYGKNAIISPYFMAYTLDNVADALEIEAVDTVLSKEKLVNEFARITQFVTWPILTIIFRLLFKVKINGQEVFHNLRGPFVIIANHTSFYDSFLFRLVLGIFTPHLPLRFMAVTKFEGKWMNHMASLGIVDFIYSLFGVFTVVPGLGIEKNIAKAKHIIAIGGNIVIYPEGRIIKDEKIGPFKNGAAVLFKQTNVPIIPVTFRRINERKLRKTIVINVGNILDISQNRSVEDITQIFYKVILTQYKKGNISTI
ncbi:MAG: 1-acyl-sn-glycerol-3-phosphate acyltransferase [Saprospiraceae bacterium]|nr:1-acyl-sn-glycerol-3-phosphate acyltransferase [Saprospiraceae bacterium]